MGGQAVIRCALEQRLVQGQATHAYQPVDGLAGGWQLPVRYQGKGVPMPLECTHTEVDAGGHACIQPNFLSAIELARGEGGEVEKRKADGFFELKDPSAHDENP